MSENVTQGPRRRVDRPFEIARSMIATAPVRRGRIEASVSVGELSQTLGLTVRAIRFYEERGLVVASRDRLGWRRYDSKAQARLQVIAWLRQADASLDQVSEILALEEPTAQREHVRAIVLARCAKLESQLDQLAGIVDDLATAEQAERGT